MERASQVGNWLLANWERVFFVAVGLAFLTSSFRLVHNDKVTEAAVVFGLSFLCFLYANVARFKRFKGLGFEAELWEDKKKEAADLIERLKSVVEIYTRETVMSRVMRMRLMTPNWEENWSLYDRLTQQHDNLGQDIDFSTLKKEVDDFFLIDLCRLPERAIRDAFFKATTQARASIDKEFGSPIKDADGYGERIKQLSEVEYLDHADDFAFSKKSDLAGLILSRYREKSQKLKDYFGIELRLDQESTHRLERLSEIYQHRPVQVTPELIEWSKER